MWTASYLLVLWAICLQRNAHAQRYPCDLSDKCQGETVCRMVYKACNSGYCPPQLTCVLPPPSGLASCSSGLPVLSSDNKTELFCGPTGSKCPDETYCKSDLVDGYAACCWKVHKPGSCPLPRSRGSCRIACNHDNNCNGDQKCCSNGCGFSCMNPGPESKPGFCPLSSPPPTKCGRLCQHDHQCTGWKKCCRTSCGTQCEKPLTFVQMAKARQQNMMLPITTPPKTTGNMGVISQNQIPIIAQQSPLISNQVSKLPQRNPVAKPANIKTSSSNPWRTLSDAFVKFLSTQPKQPVNMSPQNRPQSQVVTKDPRTPFLKQAIQSNYRATQIPQYQRSGNVNPFLSQSSSRYNPNPSRSNFASIPQRRNRPYTPPYQNNQELTKFQQLFKRPMAVPVVPGTPPAGAAPLPVGAGSPTVWAARAKTGAETVLPPSSSPGAAQSPGAIPGEGTRPIVAAYPSTQEAAAPPPLGASSATTKPGAGIVASGIAQQPPSGTLPGAVVPVLGASPPPVSPPGAVSAAAVPGVAQPPSPPQGQTAASQFRFPNQRAQNSGGSFGSMYGGMNTPGNTATAPLSQFPPRPTRQQKAGKCPQIAGVGVCEDSCTSDRDCPGNHKCCNISTCKVCLVPNIAVCPWQIKMFDMCHLIA